MRKFVVALLLPFMLVLAGCEIKQSAASSDTAASATPPYSSNTSSEDCYLCGGGIESLIPEYWGQNNVALISLNTFEVKPIEMNRYDVNGQLIEEAIGAISFGESGRKDGGFSTSMVQDYDRGYASGSVFFYDDEVLDISKMADFLCEDCLNEVLPRQVERSFGVGAVNLATKEVRIFEKCLSGFPLGDFYIHCDPKGKDGNTPWMDILIFYCPIRYEKSPDRGLPSRADVRE